MKICVDWDHTIAIENDDMSVGEPVPGAVEALYRLAADGHEIIISSGRANRMWPEPDRQRAIAHMVDAIRRYAVPHARVDYGDEGKIVADVYVDDKGCGAPLRIWRGEYVIDWPIAYVMIRERELRMAFGG